MQYYRLVTTRHPAHPRLARYVEVQAILCYYFAQHGLVGGTSLAPAGYTGASGEFQGDAELVPI
jgi:hypothetical protein